MKIDIQSLHFTADQKLLDFTNEKVEKLEHYFDSILGADVILRLDHSAESDNKAVEIILHVPGNDLFAKRQSTSFEEAINASVAAISSQVKKHKEKLKGF